ncbi:MAG: alpha-galactosidase [Bryobacteraceae bacterium]|nr:alpha-galactosidase [Bryobacteraceae bacterium]
MKILAVLAMLSLPAAAGVRHLADRSLFVLETERTSYVVGVNESKQVQLVYWGAKVADSDLSAARRSGGFAFENSDGMSAEEYAGFGGLRFVEPALKATFADGVRDVVLRYVSHEIKGETLEIRVKDIERALDVSLVYTAYPAQDIIKRSARITNRTPGKVVLESAQSATWHVPQGRYRLSYLTGRWAGETNLVREPVNPGKKILESRRGNTSHQFNPWFALDESATETAGNVWFGALGWSGNWKIVVERTPNDATQVTGGYNDFDFAYPLAAGESLETPPFYGGFSGAGFGAASRLMHRFERSQLAPDRAAPKPRPVLYNSWEATEFHVTEEGQKALATKAAKLGVELFVMDDGWFGARDHDRAGLGDWFVNKKKFPNGLKPLISHVQSLGMKFGIWVEPEMINPDSDLYRAHPDWVIHFPGRPRTETRNQLILNMAREDVKEHIFKVLDALLTENDIAFIKWDMNRHVTEPGWPAVAPSEQRKIWVQYVRNVYEIIDRLRAKHPKLEIESCSGGGGRVDYGILTRVDQVWTSDNTEAFDRLKIQEGFSFAYSPKVMMDWVTDVPNMNGRVTPLAYRFHVAMQGSLGIGGDLNKWPEQDLGLAAKMVELYKSIRGTVQEGELYRLHSPREGALTANFYVSPDGKRGVLFAFLDHQQFRRMLPPLSLKGLDAKASYRVRSFDKKLMGSKETQSGAWLMNRGLDLRLGGDYDSTVVVFERIEP